MLTGGSDYILCNDKCCVRQCDKSVNKERGSRTGNEEPERRTRNRNGERGTGTGNEEPERGTRNRNGERDFGTRHEKPYDLIQIA